MPLMIQGEHSGTRRFRNEINFSFNFVFDCGIPLLHSRWQGKTSRIFWGDFDYTCGGVYIFLGIWLIKIEYLSICLS